MAKLIIITEDGNYLIESKWNRSIRCKLIDYTWKVPRVPIQPGKSWKMTACLESLEKSWNFMILNKNPGKWYETWKNWAGIKNPIFCFLFLGLGTFADFASKQLEIDWKPWNLLLRKCGNPDTLHSLWSHLFRPHIFLCDQIHCCQQYFIIY